MLKTLTPDAMDDTAEHLCKRTEHKLPIVKLKALRCVKYLCSKGDARFRNAVSKHSGKLRACVSHAGPSDELRGDAPHKAVREMAKEALAVVFAEAAEDCHQQSTSGTGGSSAVKAGENRIQGFGGNGIGGMTGLGSQSSFGGGQHGQGGRAGFGSSRSGEWEDDERAGAGDVSGFASTSIIGDASSSAPRLNKTQGTWGVDAYSRPQPQQSQSSSTAARSTATSTLPPRTSSVDQEGMLYASIKAPFTLAGSEEERQVDAVCARGGLRITPTKEALDKFLRACDGLHATGLAQALAAKLRAGGIGGGGAWQEGYRAACCLEAAALSNTTGGKKLIVAFMADVEDALTFAGGVEGEDNGFATLREKAAVAHAAIIKKLNPSPMPSPSSGALTVDRVITVTETTGKTSPAADFDFFGLSGNTMDIPSASLVPSAVAEDVFAGLTVPDPETSCADGLGDLLGDLSVGGRPLQSLQPPQPVVVGMTGIPGMQMVQQQPSLFGAGGMIRGVSMQVTPLQQQQQGIAPQMHMQQQTYVQQMQTGGMQQMQQEQHAMGGGALAGVGRRPIPLNVFSQTSTTSLANKIADKDTGQASTYKQHKDTHAFDFVQEMMKK